MSPPARGADPIRGSGSNPSGWMIGSLVGSYYAALAITTTNLLTLLPEVSPAVLPAKVYRGMPFTASCFVPSSLVMVENFDAVKPAP